MEGGLQNKITCLFIGLWILSAGCREGSRQMVSYTLTDQEKSFLQEGDIILRKGRGFLSQFITDYLSDTLAVSHCGILIKAEGEWQVVHCLDKSVSDYDGVQTCPLDQFTEESIPYSLKIVRYKADSLHRMAEQALYYLRMRKPFDKEFNIRDTSAFFCSQLPLHILKYGLHSDLPIGNEVPRFSLFLDETYFQLIYSSGRRFSPAGR